MESENKKPTPAQIRQMEAELTSLFGEETYRKERTPCRDKYRGQYDYSLVFGSGLTLFVSLGHQRYADKLRDHLEEIRSFRANQEENRRKIKADILAQSDLFSDVHVEILPYDHTNHLTVYAAVILTMKNGLELVYRTTGMHYYLVGCKADWCTYDRYIAHLLQDALGEMRYTSLLSTVLTDADGQKGA